MSYLVDTNVVSELTRQKPDSRVLEWIESVPNSAVHLSVLTMGEIRKGIEVLDDGLRKERLRIWVEQELPDWFENRLLPVDAAVAERWGRLMAAIGRSIPAVDSLIAATALEHGLRVVTRNESDFRFPGLQVVNPWLS